MSDNDPTPETSTRSTHPSLLTFAEESESLARSGKLSLFPYNLRTADNLSKTYSPVKYLRQKALESSPAYQAAASSAADVLSRLLDAERNESVKAFVPFRDLAQEQAAETRDNDRRHVREMEAELNRMHIAEIRLREGAEQDARDGSMAALQQQQADRPPPKAGLFLMSPSGKVPLSPESTSSQVLSPSQLSSKDRASGRRRPRPSGAAEAPTANPEHSADPMQSTDSVSCPNCCGQYVRLRDLPFHVVSPSCPGRVIKCPLPGCKVMCVAGDVKWHWQEGGCQPYQKRQKMIKAAAERTAEEARKAEAEAQTLAGHLPLSEAAPLSAEEQARAKEEEEDRRRCLEMAERARARARALRERPHA